MSSDELQFLYTRLVFGTEEDITKINMRSYDDEADMKSYKLLFKIRGENDYLFQAISDMARLLGRSETVMNGMTMMNGLAMRMWEKKT